MEKYDDGSRRDAFAVEKYGGMTVNERLYLSGLIKNFDRAIEAKDIAEIRRILSVVGVSEASIRQNLVALGLGDEGF